VLDQYGNDKHFSSGFNGVFAPAAAKIRNEQAGYQSSASTPKCAKVSTRSALLHHLAGHLAREVG
jgi:hypothetical protein